MRMDWTRYKTQLEAIAPEQRDEAKAIAERLVERSQMNPDDAMAEALRRFGGPEHHSRAEKVSPDVSLAKPHGPEGESHGGRDDNPLTHVEARRLKDDEWPQSHPPQHPNPRPRRSAAGGRLNGARTRTRRTRPTKTDPESPNF